ncbi:MAG TPA: hypothetical protein VFE54_15310 [Mucilaginibacter sp.]|jgi:hypothetical protein|nr:hypothetical protein [Mucilaginibacter sp.]
MTKFILVFISLTGLWANNYPENITGKWQVEHVDLLETTPKMPLKQRNTLLSQSNHYFLKEVFNFTADHRFHLTPQIKDWPKGGSWKYDANNGVIKVTESSGIGTIMSIQVIEKSDTIFFSMQETPLIFRMIKKPD